MNIGQIVCSFHDANSSNAKGFQTKQNITVGFHANEVTLGNDKIITIDAGIALAPQDNNANTEENLVFVKDKTYVIDFKYRISTATSTYKANEDLQEMVAAERLELTQGTTEKTEWTGKVILAGLDHDYTMTLTNIPAMSSNSQERRLKLIFTPNRDYDLILIKLDRINLADFFVVAEDEVAEKQGSIPCFEIIEEISENKMIYPVCYELENIIKNMNLKRLGIQGFEGLSFAIDGEDFEMGRSGYFSLEGVNISKLACYAPPTQIGNHASEGPYDPMDRRKFFIVDYEKY